MKRRLRTLVVGVAVVAAAWAGSLGPAGATDIAGVVRGASGVEALKNSDCGWNIKTKYHSCALAYSLVFQWLSVGKEYRNWPHRVFSPNSGKRYDFECSGVRNVICRSEKGTVSFRRASVPPQQFCDEGRHVNVYAWLRGSCDFALATAAEYESKPWDENPRISVVDPISGRTYAMVCFDAHDTDVDMCINGKRAVLLYGA